MATWRGANINFNLRAIAVKIMILIDGLVNPDTDIKFPIPNLKSKIVLAVVGENFAG
ncbi:hypothetical protein [Nostoc sp. FACHB-110]|uniref:hypothetical protein n=1 Tax=Nostoc sp. FACHB-110 TaxID=2692834 RepID=UPI001681DB48|nr:hypothetical protein [Nostoc sp. FACHB-110]MBD2436336.1 hypothetical protein [Nostoc sp. FACHB-110]